MNFEANVTVKAKPEKKKRPVTQTASDTPTAPFAAASSNTPPDITTMLEDFFAFQETYDNQLVVIKFGGALAEDPKVVRTIAQQANIMRHRMGQRVVVVHGGGKQIDAALLEKGIDIVKDPATGLRVTDAATMDVCDRSLRDLNGSIVRIFNQVAGKSQAMGMAGYDARLLEGSSFSSTNFTGRVEGVNNKLLNHLLDKAGGDTIPVIYPICHAPSAHGSNLRINVNADDVASAIAESLGARRLVLASDIPGVLDKERNLIPEISTGEVSKLIQNGTITGGMIPKIEAAKATAEALGDDGGVVILNGAKPSAILVEILYRGGSGTLIRRAPTAKPGI